MPQPSPKTSGTPVSCLRALLAGLIDYAGTFPPAKLDLVVAARNFSRYLDEPHAWTLGKFIVPAGQLKDLQPALGSGKSARFPLSVLLTAEPLRDAELVADFVSRKTGPLAIEAVEVRPASPAMLAQLAEILPRALPVFCEISNLEKAAEWLGALSSAGWSAKIRTGGVTPDMFPSSIAIARFVSECKQAKIAFKATAGLHHPLRSQHPLTYEANSICGVMHGFLNVFIGASLVHAGATLDQFVAILEDTNPANFQLSEEEVHWRDLRLSTAQIVAARREFAISFGSCSFEEPVRDLQQLGLL